MILKAGWSQWKKWLENSIHYWKNVCSSCSTNNTNYRPSTQQKVVKLKDKHKYKNTDEHKKLFRRGLAPCTELFQLFLLKDSAILFHPSIFCRILRWSGDDLGVSCAKNVYDHIPSCHMNRGVYTVAQVIMWMAKACWMQPDVPKHLGVTFVSQDVWFDLILTQQFWWNPGSLVWIWWNMSEDAYSNSSWKSCQVLVTQLVSPQN